MTTGFKNGTLSVFLKGEIDHHRAASIREEIDGAVRAYLPEKLVLDFGGVTFCDSSGIAVAKRNAEDAKIRGRETTERSTSQRSFAPTTKMRTLGNSLRLNVSA